MARKADSKRRGYGTGSLRQKGHSWIGSWYAPDGRKIQRKIGPARTPGERDGMTRAEAERELARMRQEDAIVIATSSRATMQEAGEELCRALEIRGRKKSHRLTVASDLRKHIVPFFEGKDLARITPEDIERYIAVKTRTLAVKTVRNHLNTTHSVFEIGRRRRWCQTNPVKLAERPTIKKNETRIKFLDQTELDKLIATSYPDDAFGRIEPTIYLTAAMTGVRQGELIGLRWRDVDLSARRIRVVLPFVRGEFGDPKSEDSGRSIPLADRVASELEKHRERSAYATDGALVFCHPETGNPLDRSKLTRRFKKATKRAEVRTITYHELRHTFGTRMAAAGVPLRTLQYWMGHADSKTTQIYAHYQPAENEAEIVDRAFAPPT
ncbi:MAG TPA: site-specific integrase [Solirubrobacteraceae bacterium]|jgi:integrase|nr:site-specific integrase [Solirubrobacteraceae bacterium]